jgi:hypothetical protein
VGEAIADGQHLVFVGGLHRSGTSLLARLLAAHPEATGLTGTGVPEDEGQHLQPVYPAAERLGGSGRFARDARAHLTESSPLAGADAARNAQRLWDAWRPYWDSDATYLIEKSPPNLLMSRFLQELFPTASFVFIVRHPVTVTLATRKWRKRTPLPRLMENWFTAHRTARGDLPHLERVHVVSYEWLLAEPDAVVTEALRFLGMPGAVDTSSVDARGSTTYVEQWRQLLATGHRGAQRAHQRYAAQARELGYDLDDVTASPRHPLQEP